MISKKKLLETIKNIKEMPIDYGDSPERIEPGIEDKLAKMHPKVYHQIGKNF
jgi:hypothetical protein